MLLLRANLVVLALVLCSSAFCSDFCSSAGCDISSSTMAAEIPHQGLPGTNFERTFMAIKPDGVQRGLIGEIVSRMEKKGFSVVGLKMVRAPRGIVEQHYAEHAARPFFAGLVEFFTSGPVVLMALQGRRVIDSARTQIGKTKPEESAAGTIRGDFAVDVGRNLIHGSDSAESAERELKLWFAEGELIAWDNVATPWLYEKM